MVSFTLSPAHWYMTELHISWTMMGTLVSRERMESQWRLLLGEAGFRISGVWHKETESVIEAVLEDDG